MAGFQEQATEKVDTAKQAVQERMDDAAGNGRGVLRSQIDRGSTQAGERAQSMAQALRQSASQMRSDGDQDKLRYAGMADRGADRLEQVGDYLKRADADEIVGKVEGAARRQPWLVAGAGLLIGVAGARFLKASSSDRYQRMNGPSAEWGMPESWTPPRRRDTYAEPLEPRTTPVQPPGTIGGGVGAP